MHNLVEHYRLRRGLRTIYCRFFAVIAVNPLAVSLNMLVVEDAPSLPASAIAAARYSYPIVAKPENPFVLRYLFRLVLRRVATSEETPPSGGSQKVATTLGDMGVAMSEFRFANITEVN